MFSRKSKRTSSSMKMVLFQTDKNNNTLSITQINPTVNSLNNARDIMNVPGSTYRNKSVGMSWGSPTWIFLHTLVEKIKDEHFSRMRNEVLKNIYLSFFYGAKIGVLGLNGSGKSTLLEAIAVACGIYIWRTSMNSRYNYNKYEASLHRYLKPDWTSGRVRLFGKSMYQGTQRGGD